MASQSPDPSDSINVDNASAEAVPHEESSAIGSEDVKTMRGIIDNLASVKDEEGDFVFQAFFKRLNKRNYPDYFEVIKEHVAFSSIRDKFLKKKYTSFAEFVRDVALISHNAQVYNRPSAPVYRSAILLREKFEAELDKLVNEGYISKDIATLPDLGELPPVGESPPEEDEEEEGDADEDEEEEDEDVDEEEDDSGDDSLRKRRGRKARRSSGVTKRDSAKIEEKEDPEAHKKRGRPPKVHTPMEARINALLKGLRKFKNELGDLKILPFEKLPDKQLMPEYYQEIKNPMAMDMVKKKAKRKKYVSVDQAMKDLELMFENAKSYNLEDSQVYRDAVDLQKEARLLAEQEKKKPDSEYVDEDGRLPLPQILHNNEVWKVGDWVHIVNRNDVTKPIVAQIYRTWQDKEGQKWINACWYYRPEWTVHRHDKHFYDMEVVKTGRYMDHLIDEVVDRCFVMFFTRYSKGRPRGFPADKDVYVCEARYNEIEFKLNKIKTWASCVPDEVRDKDYEMDLFDVPRKMKKVPSPIKHLLQDDANEDSPLPKPTWGPLGEMAPPIIGAVHKRAREANESPPPEPTPSPPPRPPVEPVRSYQNLNDRVTGPQVDLLARQAGRTPAAPQNSVQGSYGQQFAPSRLPGSASVPMLQPQNAYGAHSNQQPGISPSQFPSHSYSQYSNPQATPTPAAPQNLSSNPANTHEFGRNSSGIRSSIPMSANLNNAARPVEVFHLPDSASASIPAEIRHQFHRDEHGRVYFFTQPPNNVSSELEDPKLGHSLRYRAAKIRQRLFATAQNEEIVHPTEESQVQAENGGYKRKDSPDRNNEDMEESKRSKLNPLEAWAGQLDAGTDQIYKNLYGPEWKTYKAAAEVKLAADQEERARFNKEMSENAKKRAESQTISLGRRGLY